MIYVYGDTPYFEFDFLFRHHPAKWLVGLHIHYLHYKFCRLKYQHIFSVHDIFFFYQFQTDKRERNWSICLTGKKSIPLGVLEICIDKNNIMPLKTEVRDVHWPPFKFLTYTYYIGTDYVRLTTPRWFTLFLPSSITDVNNTPPLNLDIISILYRYIAASRVLSTAMLFDESCHPENR